MAVIQYFCLLFSHSYTHRLFSKLFRHNPRIPSLDARLRSDHPRTRLYERPSSRLQRTWYMFIRNSVMRRYAHFRETTPWLYTKKNAVMSVNLSHRLLVRELCKVTEWDVLGIYLGLDESEIRDWAWSSEQCSQTNRNAGKVDEERRRCILGESNRGTGVLVTDKAGKRTKRKVLLFTDRWLDIQDPWLLLAW